MAKDLLTIDYSQSLLETENSVVMQSSRGLVVTFSGTGIDSPTSTISLYFSIDGKNFSILKDDLGADVVITLDQLDTGATEGYIVHADFPGQWVQVLVDRGSATTGVVNVRLGGREAFNR